MNRKTFHDLFYGDEGMSKIVLIGLLCESNLGDPLSFDCSNYIIHQMDPSAEVEYLDFKGRSSIETNNSKNIGNNAVKGIYSFLKSIFGTHIQEIAFQRRRQHCEQYYDEHFRNASLVVVVAAGTITYDVRLDCGPYYSLVAKYAKKYNIPVVVNSGGVENPFIAFDRRSKRLSDALSSNAYKIVTTRDNLSELKKYVRNPDTIVDKVADVGVWSAETFGIQRDHESDLVGIGIITYKRFVEFKKGISHEQYNQTIINVITQLEAKGRRWKMFTNGFEADYENAIEICKSIKMIPEECIAVPKTPHELVEIISGFKGIITSRLHSCIVAYSLGIPYIALSWNNKLEYFSEAIGYTERTVDQESFSAGQILERYEKAVEEGYDEDQRTKYRESAILFFKKYLELANS